MDAPIQRLSTGITGLDVILGGGYESGCSYLVSGRAGTGKTILGLHFLMAGIKNNETTLIISLQETEPQLRTRAARIGLDISKVHILDLSPPQEFFSEAAGYDIFSPAEVERGPTSRRVIESLESLKPTRIFIDPIQHFRYLSIDQFHFRKQILSFLKYLSLRQATVLASSDPVDGSCNNDLQSMVDSILSLEHSSLTRTLLVQKIRGSGFMEGVHSLRISNNGIEVIPNSLPPFLKQYNRDILSSGVPQIDELLNGGIERGTITLVSGPSGVGKTTFGMQFMKEAAGRGERSVVFACEEEPEMIVQRCESIGMPARAMIENKTLIIYRIDPKFLMCDELQDKIRFEIEHKNAEMFMLDSITSYANCLPERSILFRNLEMIGSYLEGYGATLILTSETSNIIENTSISNLGLGGFSDNIVFMRYIELNGEIRRAIGVLKKRLSNFEKRLRDFEITQYGIEVGRPLTGLRGILKGIPEEIK
jgi:circadian clock protein KaiC